MSLRLDRMKGNGGEGSQCGWFKDKYGLWWQIVPKTLDELMGDKDLEKTGNVMQAMLKMKKVSKTSKKTTTKNKLLRKGEPIY